MRILAVEIGVLSLRNMTHAAPMGSVAAAHGTVCTWLDIVLRSGNILLREVARNERKFLQLLGVLPTHTMGKFYKSSSVFLCRAECGTNRAFP